MPSKIIKSAKFEDGSFTIKSPSEPSSSHPQAAKQAPAESGLSVAAQAQADALIKGAQAQADQLVAMAEAEAEAIKEQALKEIEAMKLRAFDEGKQQGFAAGVAEGQEAGLQEVVDRHQTLLTALADQVEQTGRARVQVLADQEEDLVKLAIMIAQKVLLMELSTSRECVVTLTEAAIARLADKTSVRVRVATQDLPLVEAARERLMLQLDHLGTLEVIGDDRVGLGGCLIETRTGTVDARISTQLAAVAAALLEIPPGHEGEMDAAVTMVVKALEQGDATALLQPSGLPPVAPPPLPVAPPAAFVPAPAPVAEPAPPPPAPPAPEFIAPEPPSAPPIDLSPLQAPAAPHEQEGEAPPQAVVRETPASDPEPPSPGPEPLDGAPDVPLPVGGAAAGAGEGSPVAPAPEPAPAPAPPAVDPSRAAAEALAFRLGQVKKARQAAATDEQAMAALEAALSDEAIDAIVGQVMAKSAMDAPGEPVQAPPGSLDMAAEALAARLGKKKRRYTDEDLQALGDGSIQEILQTIVPAAPAEAPGAAPDLDLAAERLAERMGKKIRKPQFESFAPPDAASPDPLAGALADESIDQIMGAILPTAPAETPKRQEAPRDLDRASDALSELLGKKKKGNRPWYADLEGS